MMSVFKIEKNQNYTVMSNHHLRDRNLSYKAKGLLSFMLLYQMIGIILLLDYVLLAKRVEMAYDQYLKNYKNIIMLKLKK